ncbi:MAG: SpoIVB peptidase [Firmicutes bacterium]|nr:SpoIVB peptidase [Bacillota bacterium]
MHNFNKRKKTICFVALIVVLAYAVQIYNIIHFPSQIDIIKGESKNIDVIFPFTADILNMKKDNILKLSEEDRGKLGLKIKNSYDFETLDKGIAKIEFKLLGLIPVKDIKVNIIDRLYLVPGGHSIGVKLNTKGVLVVALSQITGADGKIYNPAKSAGIKIGDAILEINDIKVKDSNHVIKLLNDLKNKKIKIKVQRNKKNFTTFITPIKSKQDNCYRLGLWVRDKTAGIGTLTFYDKNSNYFGALGHGITDIDTAQLMTVEHGEIMEAKVSSIEQGKKGLPGEIRGIFFDTDDILGNIERNTLFGIYGKIKKDVNNNLYKEVPIALQNEVKEGKAYILTTVEDNKIEKYDIEVIKKELQKTPDQKSMVIKVTDKELLKKTGGIVQGMSGSPIIQDGKLIGAVTHVFVSDPTKGYGLYIEWMLREAGILLENNSEFAEAK